MSQQFLRLGFRVDDDGHVYTGVFRKVDRGPVENLRVEVSKPVLRRIDRRIVRGRPQVQTVDHTVNVKVFFPDMTTNLKNYTTTVRYEKRLGGDLLSRMNYSDNVGDVMKEYREFTQLQQDMAVKQFNRAAELAEEINNQAKAEAEERVRRVKALISTCCPVCEAKSGKSCKVVAGTEGMTMLLLDKKRGTAAHEIRIEKAIMKGYATKEDLESQMSVLTKPLEVAFS
jgi:hypothetical protein